MKMHFRADHSRVAPCRRRAAQWVRTLGAPPRTVEVVALLTSELVTNAVKYGPTDGLVRVDVDQRGALVRISVRDDSPTAPTVRCPEPSAPGGRGMLLVQRLSRAWGVDQHRGDGKTVWCDLALVV